MNVLYDTSALLALFLEDHPDHEKAIQTHVKLIENDSEFYICTHSIAEIYSNLTRGIKYFKFSPSKAYEVIKRDLADVFSIVDLNSTDYLDTIKYLKAEKLTGAVVYDGIIVKASSKIDAKYIVTFNERDFKR